MTPDISVCEKTKTNSLKIINKYTTTILYRTLQPTDDINFNKLRQLVSLYYKSGITVVEYRNSLHLRALVPRNTRNH